MVLGQCRVIWLFQLGLLLVVGQVQAQDADGDDDSMGEMEMHTNMVEESESEEELMGKGPLPACFETEKTYVGYPMDNPETKERYLKGCPNPQHCQMMCQEAKDCEWFNWTNHTCPMTGNLITRCWMKTGKGDAKMKTGEITGPKFCELKGKRNCIERDRMYIGDGLNVWVRRRNNFGRQKTEARCQDLCKRTNGCKWFNWNKKSQCWLKRSHGQRIKANVRLEPGVSTGPRECPKIPTGQSCDEGWKYFEGNCYSVNLKMDNATMQCHEAKQSCLDKNSSLVSFQSRKEFNFVTEILDRNHFQQQGIDFWVAAKRSSDDQEFKWEEDSTVVEVFKWAVGEPSDGNKCLQLFKDDTANWAYETENCESQDDDGSFICEKPANQNANEEVTVDNETTESVLQVTTEVVAADEETQPTTLNTEDEVTEAVTEPTTEIPLSDDTNEESQAADMNGIPCSTPDIDNGNMVCTDEFDCSVSCNDGYVPHPHSLYRCSDGLWEKAAHSEPVLVEEIKCSTAKVVIGGCSTSTNETIIQISDSTETCSIAPIPGNVCHYGYTLDFVDGTLIACGGTPDPKKCLKFHYKTKTWKEAAELNVARMDSSSVVLDSSIYIIGGEGEGATRIETVSFNSAEDSFESFNDTNVFTYDVTGDACMVATSSDTILTLTGDKFFSYNISSGTADDLDVPFPGNERLPCAKNGQKLMVLNAADGPEDSGSVGYIYDLLSKTWTPDIATGYTSGQFLNIEGGKLVRINTVATAGETTMEARIFHYNQENNSYERFDHVMPLAGSTINGPATTVPADLFTCERFALEDYVQQ